MSVWGGGVHVVLDVTEASLQCQLDMVRPGA